MPARSLDERTLNVFEAAETIILAVNPEISALKAVHALLDYLNEAGTIGAKSMFVLNNMFARDILKPRDIEAALGTKITIDLPYDPFLYLKAVNEGVPIVIGAPRSPPPSAWSSCRRPPSAPTASPSRPRPRRRAACSASGASGTATVVRVGIGAGAGAGAGTVSRSRSMRP